jgi:hypothetical protein
MFVLSLSCVMAGQAAAAVSVATNDGVVLTLNNDGSWNSLTIDGTPAPELSGVTGGFVIARMEGTRIPWQRNVFYAGTPVTGTATQQGSDVHFTATAEGISFDITLSGGGSYIGVDGTVTGPGTDRVFIVYFRMPVDADGWKWWDHINMSRTIANGSANWYLSNRQNPDIGVFHQARHPDLSLNPFGSISRTSGAEMGLSVSPLFYPPCAYAALLPAVRLRDPVQLPGRVLDRVRARHHAQDDEAPQHGRFPLHRVQARSGLGGAKRGQAVLRVLPPVVPAGVAGRQLVVGQAHRAHRPRGLRTRVLRDLLLG